MGKTRKFGSSRVREAAVKGDRVCVEVPPGPISPWLRLAHLSPQSVQAKPAGRDESFLRVLSDFELVFQVRGSAWLGVDALGGSFDIHAGEVALIPPGLAHAWVSRPGMHLAIHFDLHAQPKLIPMDNIVYLNKRVSRNPLSIKPVLQINRRAPLDGGQGESIQEPLLYSMVTKVRNPRLWREQMGPLIQLWNRRAQRSLEGQLAVVERIGWALNSILSETRKQSIASTSLDPALSNLLRDLDQNLAETPSVAQMAQQVGMGLTSFRQAFFQATGRSPRQYVETVRMEYAARTLAETDQAIYQVASEVGYLDPYHFSRAFKRVIGMSPRAYRYKKR